MLKNQQESIMCKDIRKQLNYKGSSNKDFRTLTVDNSSFTEALSVKLAYLNLDCFAKSPWKDKTFNNMCKW